MVPFDKYQPRQKAPYPALVASTTSLRKPVAGMGRKQAVARSSVRRVLIRLTPAATVNNGYPGYRPQLTTEKSCCETNLFFIQNVITPHPLSTFFTAKYPFISSRVGRGWCPLAVPAADPITRCTPRTPAQQGRSTTRHYESYKNDAKIHMNRSFRSGSGFISPHILI